MRSVLILLAALFFAAPVVAVDHAYQISAATTDYGLDLGGYVYCEAIYAWDEDIGVEFVLNGVEIDSAGVRKGNGWNFTVHCDSLNIIRSVSTRVTVLLGYPDGPCPSFGGGYASAMVDAQSITITNGYHTAALSSYAFLPLSEMGEHNLAGIQISWATADTIWVQVLCSDVPMDSLTAFNWGTAAAPEYSKRLVLTDFASGAPAGFAATGGYTTFVPFSWIVQDADGYPGLPRYIGVRVRAPAAEAITLLKIVLYLGTLNTCGGA